MLARKTTQTALRSSRLPWRLAQPPGRQPRPSARARSAIREAAAFRTPLRSGRLRRPGMLKKSYADADRIAPHPCGSILPHKREISNVAATAVAVGHTFSVAVCLCGSPWRQLVMRTCSYLTGPHPPRRHPAGTPPVGGRSGHPCPPGIVPRNRKWNNRPPYRAPTTPGRTINPNTQPCCISALSRPTTPGRRRPGPGGAHPHVRKRPCVRPPTPGPRRLNRRPRRRLPPRVSRHRKVRAHTLTPRHYQQRVPNPLSRSRQRTWHSRAPAGATSPR